LFGPWNFTLKFTEQFKGQVHVQNVSPQLVTLKPFLKLTIMPMQRKRPRDREDRFHYRFLERYDFIETSNILLLSTCIILFLGMQARKGINAEEMVLAGMITALASAFGVEARKKRCVTRLPPGIKPLRVSDLSDDEYFYRRFRFRKEHLVHFMMLINLYDHDKQEYQKIALDSERHYCYADTAMLIFLARMAEQRRGDLRHESIILRYSFASICFCFGPTKMFVCFQKFMVCSFLVFRAFRKIRILC
jgi:hypothetical protein